VGDDAVARFLGLEDDLGKVEEAISDDETARHAYDRHRGLRIPRDDPFACVVSFIASAQSRNERTRGVVRRLCEEQGETRDGWCAHTFPSPEKVASLSEEGLRELGFGYRAPYVKETARTVAEEGVGLESLRGAPYEEAREELKRLKGVGDKVADCVLLFSLGFVGVVALDTWLNRIVNEHYPSLRGRDVRRDRARLPRTVRRVRGLRTDVHVPRGADGRRSRPMMRSFMRDGVKNGNMRLRRSGRFLGPS